MMSSGTRFQQSSTLLPVLLLGACSVLDTSFLATTSDVEGGKPSAVEARFTGNQSLGDGTLRDAVRAIMLNLSRGQAPEVAAYDGADAIQNHYRDEGFPDVEVEWRVDGPLPRTDLPDLVTIHFSIVEGPQITVAEMTIEGDAADPDLLLLLWERKHSGALGLGAPVFVLRNIQAFVDAISTQYRQRGYLEIEVAPPLILRNDEARTASVVLQVAEGRRFRFGSIVLEPRLIDALGDEMPALPEGEVFTTQRTQELLLDLQARLRRLGYPDPVVRIPPFPELDSAVIDLQVQGGPGRLATVSEIRITGDEATRESFIRGKLRVEVGDRYNGSTVDEALARLYRTGLFRRVQIQHEWIDDKDMRLIVDVDEAETRSIELLAGYGSYERLRGGVVFGERNLFGTGRSFFIDGKISQRGYRTSASVSDPDLFGSDVRGTLEVESFSREMPSFTDEAAGGTASIARELVPRLTGRFGYTYLPRSGSSTDVGGPGGALVNFTQGSLFLNFRYDDRDSVLSPTAGSSAFLGLDYFDQSLGGDVSFVRLQIGGTHHIPLGRGFRIALRADAGWIGPEESSLGVPIQERFFNGGENTVRSFRQDQLGPKDSFGNPVGGEFRNVLTAELRVPIYRSIEAAVFADAGNVGRLVQDYTLKELSYALGGGLRIALPIGPLRLDGGWNPDPAPEERPWTVHFSIGYPF